MKTETTNQANNNGTILVLGGTGKTGRRIVRNLNEQGIPVRVGSRSAAIPFDWNNEATWDANLKGIQAVYISYTPDLAMPGAVDTITAFVDRAKSCGVAKLVLLSGRGEAEAQACEQVVLNSGLAATVVRASWFNQNFSEGAFFSMVESGKITVPVGEVREPFIDVEDIAEVATVALTQKGHEGEIYEVTGPRLMTFSDVASELSNATGRPIEHVQIPHEAFIDGAAASGAPKEVVWMLDYLFATVLDGRNESLTDGVQRALGRPPRDFSDFAREDFAENAAAAVR